MILSIGADHAGYDYKQRIVRVLEEQGHEVLDCGTNDPAPTDYPRWIRPAARAVADGRAERGIILGGSGNGEAIVANRLPGIRCAVCWDERSAHLARHHNDANMISLGQRMVDFGTALRIVQIFLTEPFDGGRHAERIRRIDEPDPDKPTT
jgi:ribose 5-phosphate isomerase B